MEAKIAAGVLFAALLACGYQPSGTFHAKSARVEYAQVCEQAIELGEDDTGIIGEAGGVKIGVYEGDAAGYVSHEIAYFGGTHYLARSSSTAYTSHGWHARKHQDARFDVFRVPVKMWYSLPPALKPAAQ